MTTKKQATRRAIVNSFNHVVEVGYCDLPNLLKYEDRYAYTAGVYGWNSDIFMVDFDHCISTGYRPFGDIKPSRALCDFFDGKAKELIETIKDKGQLVYSLRELQAEFVRAAISSSEQAS